MSDKFRNRYRIASTLLQNWDYGWNAMYFVTICTKNRICFFGDIHCRDATHRVSTMQLSQIGKIADTEWRKTFALRPDMNLEMGEYIVMPNHFHAVIGIGSNEYNSNHAKTKQPVNQFGPQSKNLASIIRGFKSAVTVNARKIDSNFGWQSRFHDHVIRNQGSFDRIQSYIVNNPLNWKNDSFYKK